MNRDNNHPRLTEPPITHALDQWNPETMTLTYEYNGRNILSMYWYSGNISTRLPRDIGCVYAECSYDPAIIC
jgi:hypothetical protein